MDDNSTPCQDSKPDNVYFSSTNQGISVMNFGDSYNCFVVPIGSNRTKTRHDLKIAISNYDGERIALNDRQQNFEVMPGYVKDASFLPQEAKNRCLTYQWLVAVKHGKSLQHTSSYSENLERMTLFAFQVWMSLREPRGI